MHLKQSLTKESFWNKMMETYPNATKKFCEWIDEYKQACEWEKLFGKDLKFHDLPHAMQQGIWLEYICQRGGCQFEIEDFYEYDLAEDIEGFFGNLLEEEALAEID